ncbi:MAG: hypothetical protein KGJ86_10770, partial [Chloroflexota bacterium]|nr:hypothetical protein [Chloroflexota bacterium]
MTGNSTAASAWCDDRAERLLALIRPEFRQDVYVADPSDDILTYKHKGCIFDFRPAPRLMRLELQYAVQCRHDARVWRVYAYVVNWLARDIASCRDDDSFTTSTRPHAYTLRWRQRERGWWRYVASLASEVYDQREEFERDTWDLKHLGLASKGQTHFLHFEQIPQLWLRQLVKQAMRYHVARGLAGYTLSTHNRALADFACWLQEHHADVRKPEMVDRSLVERFVIFLRGTQHPANAKHKVLALKAFLEDAEQFGWARFAGRVYETD